MELIKTKEQLPATIEELRDFILIGQEKIKVYQAKIRAIDKVGLAKEVRDKALEDGQYMGKAILWAEVKFGELLKIDPPGFQRGNSGQIRQNPLPKGITKKQSHYAQQLADNTDVIEEVIKEAIKKEEIPTRYEALKRIQKKKRKEQREAMKIPPLHKELMPPDSKGRKIRIMRNAEEKKWEIQWGPNEAGVKLKAHIEEMEIKPEFLSHQEAINEMKAEVEALKEQIKAMEDDIKRQERSYQQNLKESLNRQYGLICPYTETIQFKIKNERLDEYIATLPIKEVREFLMQPNGNIEPCETGYWGDIRDLEFSDTKIISRGGWVKLGWGDPC